jgi:hypothetical protein
MNKLDADRLKANRALAALVLQLVEANPSCRFGQILRNYDFIKEKRNSEGTPESWHNEFNTEPMVVLERVKRAIKNTPG